MDGWPNKTYKGNVMKIKTAKVEDMTGNHTGRQAGEDTKELTLAFKALKAGEAISVELETGTIAGVVVDVEKAGNRLRAKMATAARNAGNLDIATAKSPDGKSLIFALRGKGTPKSNKSAATA